MSLNISKSAWKKLYRSLRELKAGYMLTEGKHRVDRLAHRAEIARKISDTAVDNRIQLNIGGTDCDGYQWDTCYLIPATVTHYLGLTRFEMDWVDGPAGSSFSKPEAGVFDWYELQHGVIA